MVVKYFQFSETSDFEYRKDSTYNPISQVLLKLVWDLLLTRTIIVIHQILFLALEHSTRRGASETVLETTIIDTQILEQLLISWHDKTKCMIAFNGFLQV